MAGTPIDSGAADALMNPVWQRTLLDSESMGDRLESRKSSQPYSAPPIIEAVIELVFAEPASSSALRKLAQKLGRNYENSQAQERIGAKLNFAAREAEFDGETVIKASSVDEADSLTIGANLLTWSRLAPYEGWGNLLGRLQRDFEIAHEVTGPRKLSRIGVRYINRLDIPMIDGVAIYEDYLAIKVSLPKSIPVIRSYAWRFEQEFIDKHLLAIVQSVVVEPELPKTGAFLLDIDIVAMHDLPLRANDLFTKLEEMRALKNEMFEISITNKARETFL